VTNPLKSFKIYFNIPLNQLKSLGPRFFEITYPPIILVLFYDIPCYSAYPIVQDFPEKSKSMLIHGLSMVLIAKVPGLAISTWIFKDII
jgi:hypothetical protein